MSLSFDILLEGTMIGAEASALIEAADRIDLSPKSDAKEYAANIQYELNRGITSLRTFYRSTLIQINNLNRIAPELHDDLESLVHFMESSYISHFNNVVKTLHAVDEIIAQSMSGNDNSLTNIPKLAQIVDNEYKMLYNATVEIDQRIDQLNAKIKRLKLPGSQKVPLLPKTTSSSSKALVPVKVDSAFETMVKLKGNNSIYNKMVQDRADVSKNQVTPYSQRNTDVVPYSKGGNTGIITTKTKKVLDKKLPVKLPEEKKIEQQPIYLPAPTDIKSTEKSVEVAKTFVDKIKKLYNDIKKQLVEPTVKGMVITLGLAIASYLAFYGLIKSSKGNVKSIINVITTFKAGYQLVKNNNTSLGKKILIISVGIITLGFIGALGTQGFNYIKNYLNKSNKK